MRKLLFFFGAFLFSFQVFSQEFGTSDSEWVYDKSGGFLAGVVKITFEKDTLIGTRQCTKFNREYITRSTSQLAPRPIYFYNNDGIVEFSFRGIDFDLLYNFKKGAGSNWRIYRRSFINNVLFDSVLVRINAVFKDTINGKELLAQRVTYSGLNRNFTYDDVIYESLGPKFDYIFPWDFEERQRDGGEGGAVRCFRNNELGLVELDTTRYINRYEYDCEQLVGIDGTRIPAYQLSIYPNPSLDKLEIFSEEGATIQLTISDLLGRNLMELTVLPGSNEIDISGLTPGIYHVMADGWAIHRILKN